MNLPNDPKQAPFLETSPLQADRHWAQGHDTKWYVWVTASTISTWHEAVPNNCTLQCIRPCTIVLGGQHQNVVPGESLTFGPDKPVTIPSRTREWPKGGTFIQTLPTATEQRVFRCVGERWQRWSYESEKWEDVQLEDGTELACVVHCVASVGVGRIKQFNAGDFFCVGNVIRPEPVREPEKPKGLLRYVFDVIAYDPDGLCLVALRDGTPIAKCDAKQDADELAFALNLAVSAWAAKTPGARLED